MYYGLCENGEFSTKTTELAQPRPQRFPGSGLVLFLVIARIIDVILPKMENIFQIWSMLAGYEELAGKFEPIREGEIF